MIVVGDASALIALHQIDGWPVLPRLYGEVHVPEAVWHEVFSAARFSAVRPVPPTWLAAPCNAFAPDSDAGIGLARCG